ncbi:phosphatidylserine decarboxylase [Campylobacter geochelonis]|uniref:phosphatidylserine decarboxylase n=1 Tax=Campylobacter geochelonis TaxID=1780362 RepID=UPI000770B708|nr:phosphatidylserine decarboxylase [Campylobacter geochelonis]CZE49408.1 phosphatidylserine decarboxylase [Campylobacter geochelonis]
MTNLISQIFGLIANIKFPKKLQTFINKRYIKAFKIDMSEFDDASSYKSLNALFTRTFVKPRDFSSQKNTFISPSDGLIFEVGKSDSLKALCVKNHNYSIDRLLGMSASKDELKGEIIYANIYLSPSDYHHYHAPCDLEILSAFYVPAKLYSVAKKWLIKVPNLYCKNERVVLKTRLENGKILWLVFVGALNVGKMKFDFDNRIQTNANASYTQFYEYENLYIKKGEHIGNFELGSTIVLLAQNGALEFELTSEQKVKFGDIIGKINLENEDL